MVDYELGSVCLRWGTTDEENLSAVGEKVMKNGTELNEIECFGVKPFSAISVLVRVVRGNYGTPPLSTPLRGRMISSTEIDSTEMTS